MNENEKRLAEIVRKLRGQLFDKTRRLYPHERMWEEEGQEEMREKANAKNKIAWDKETERLIEGK